MKSILSLVAAVMLITISASAISAQDRTLPEPWGKSCSQFTSERQFVSESSYYCLRQQNQRACHRRAEAMFSSCAFAGDYQRISQRLHAKMLVVWALAGTRQSTKSGHS